jgi:hypothetical protein
MAGTNVNGGLKADLTAAVICHLDEDTVVLDRINTWTGTSEHPVQISDVEIWLTQAPTTYHPVTVILDPWQAIGLAQRLKRQRIRVEEYNFTAPSAASPPPSTSSLANTASHSPKTSSFSMNSPTYDSAKPPPGVYRMDHDPDKHDDQAIALALAANHLITRPKKRQWGAI